jgi:7-cyano-7-deazaguanine synthase
MHANDTHVPRAVVLLSGGLDRTTVLAMARARGFDVHALCFDYGQKQRVELERAQAAARRFGAVECLVAHIDLRAIGGSALVSDVPVPKGGAGAAVAPSPGVPITYVPARNTIFLAHALALAEARGARDLFIGVSHVDYSGYPDCRPAFLQAFEALANLATRAADDERLRVRLHAPLLHLSKADTIRQGLALGVDYADTHTCYDPDPRGGACGGCEACRLRRQGFAAAGVADPTHYAAAAAASVREP